MIIRKYSDHPVEWTYLASVGYSTGLSIQRELHQQLVLNGTRTRGYLLLLEHDRPVITMGRFAKESNILISAEDAERRGIELHRVERGGDVTLHAPGQLVGYPIIKLKDFRLGAKAYVHLLEETLIAVLDRFDLRGERNEGYPGVWMGGDKIAAIGVNIKRSITTHGFALNVNTDLSYFSLIVPCGIRDRKATSMRKALGREISLAELAPVFAREFGRIFDSDMSFIAALPNCAENSSQLSVFRLRHRKYNDEEI